MTNEGTAARSISAKFKAAAKSKNGWKSFGAVIAILVVALIASFLLYNASKNNTPKNEQSVRHVNDQEVDQSPLEALGCSSWTQFQQKAAKNAAMWTALAMVRPDISKADVKELVAAEARGKSFVKELPVGTVITNTGLKNGQAYVVTGYTIKKGDVLVLVDKQGVPTVKVSCGNPISPANYVTKKPSEPKPEPKKEESCPTRNSDPKGKYTPHHPGTATYYNPPAPASSEAPNYSRGNAEEVDKNRGTGESSMGSPGNGSGGTTPGGSTGEVGSSTTEVNKGHTSPPDITTTEDVVNPSTNPPPPN